MDIRVVNPDHPQVRQLIEFHLSGMMSNSPEGSVHALNSSGLTATDITLFGAFETESCLSIGALKTLSTTDGEIKSMRTAPVALGRGFGKAILTYIIGVARARGFTTLSLETGTGPSFAAAHHIYETHGFTRADAFGDYSATDFNRFLSLNL